MIHPSFQSLFNFYREQKRYGNLGQIKQAGEAILDKLELEWLALNRNTLENWLTNNKVPDRPANRAKLLIIALVICEYYQDADQLVKFANPNFHSLQNLQDDAVKSLRNKKEAKAILFLLRYMRQILENKPNHAPIPFTGPEFIIGRKMQINNILKFFSDFVSNQGQKTCLISGLPGIGKTHLARWIGQKMQQANPDLHVIEVTLQNRDLKGAIFRVLNHLGTDLLFIRDVNQLSLSMKEILKSKKVFLILDDVLDTKQLELLLPNGDNNFALFTSRNQDLANAKKGLLHCHLSALSPDESFELLKHKKVPMWDLEKLSQLTKAVEYHPLAINIIARILNPGNFLRSKKDVATVREASANFLLDDLIGALAYSSNALIETFQFSFKQLGANEQFLLNLLSLWDGDFSLEAVTQISLQNLAVVHMNLSILLDWSFFTEGDGARWRLHSLIREYTQTFASIDKEYKNRWINYYLDLVIDNPNQNEILSPDYKNILKALNLATSEPKLEEASLNMFAWWHAHGPYSDAISVYRRVLCQPNIAMINRVKLKARLGRVLSWQGDQEEATEVMLTALSNAESLPYSRDRQYEIGYIHIWLGTIFLKNGDFDECETQFEKAHEIATQIDDNSLLLSLMINEGALAIIQGNKEDARCLLEQGKQIGIELEDKGLLGMVMQNLGLIYHEEGNFGLAIEVFTQGLILAQETNHQLLELRMRGNLGLSQLARGRNAPDRFSYKSFEAKENLKKALRIARKLNYAEEIYRQQASLAKALSYESSEVDCANILFEDAVLGSTNAQNLHDSAKILNMWGMACLSQDALIKAEEKFSQALEICDDLRLIKQLGRSRFGLARVAAIRKDIDTAISFASKALINFEGIDHYETDEVRLFLNNLRHENDDSGLEEQ